MEKFKISYEPSEKKRFEISKDEFSRERLSVVKSFYEKIHEKFDISMGLVLFGSLSKGKELNVEENKFSDIDFTLYLDIDEYKKDYIKNLEKNKDFLSFEFFRLGSCCRDSSERKLLSDIFQKIKDQKVVTLEEKKIIENKIQNITIEQFIFFLAVWHGYADFFDSEGGLQKFSYRGKPQYSVEKISHLLRIKDVQVWPIQLNGEFSIKSQVEKVKNISENINDEDDRQKYILFQERFGIIRMFGLDVGGGMKPYRQAFIQELLLLPKEEGEKLWEIVNESVRILERMDLIPENMEKQFPKTLEDATRYYGCD